MPEDQNSTNQKRPWFEPVCALLMAISSLSTAWCSYQNSLWSGQSSELEAFADKREREAAALHLEARQTESVYVRLVMEVIDDKLEGNEKQAEFYLSRFPSDLRAAWDKWMSLKPFDAGSSASAHPMLPEYFTHSLEGDIRNAQSEAHEAEGRARETGDTASHYLTNTVLLATVLFLAGTAGSFDKRRIRWSALGFALVLFAYAALRTIHLPIA